MAGERVEHGVGGDVGGLALGHQRRARRRDEHEQLDSRRLSSLLRREGAAGLGADDGGEVGGRRQGDRVVAQLAGGVHGAVEPADLRLGLVEGGGDVPLVRKVGDDDGDLGAERLELGEPANPPARRIVVAVAGEPLAARRPLWARGGWRRRPGWRHGRRRDVGRSRNRRRRVRR